MKKKYFLGAIFGTVLGIAIAVMMSVPKKAHCAFCPSYKCTSSSVCGSGCLCLKAPGEFWGDCYSAD